jgi:hypothetical protein
MIGHGEKLSRKQEHAIASSLAAPTIAEVARQTGIGARTLLRWLKEAHFQAAYRNARRQVVEQAIAQVQRATGAAVDTLQAIMANSAAPAGGDGRGSPGALRGWTWRTVHRCCSLCRRGVAERGPRVRYGFPDRSHQGGARTSHTGS